MMHQNVARIHLRAARLLGLLLLAGLMPACYSRSGKTYTPPPMLGGSTTLFSEDFFPYPNAGWNGPTVSNATAAQVFMSPFYYLQMTDSSRPGSASTFTTMSFSSQALTFVVDLQFSATSTQPDHAFIQIVDSANTATVLAQADLDTTTSMIAFTVGGGAATSVAFAAGSFKTVTFTVDGANNAHWQMGATSTTPAAFGSHATKLLLSSSYPAGPAVAGPTFLFGNVIINSP